MALIFYQICLSYNFKDMDYIVIQNYGALNNRAFLQTTFRVESSFLVYSMEDDLLKGLP